MFLVIESKTHKIARHLRFEKATEAGVLARDEGFSFMSSQVFELKVSARKFCKRNRIDIKIGRAHV